MVVAAATGTPELATMLISKLRGHHDVGLGNILGSNIFNALFISARAALIRPYEVTFSELQPSLVLGVVTTLLILPGKGGKMGHWRGFVLLLIYAGYVAMSIQAGNAHH